MEGAVPPSGRGLKTHAQIFWAIESSLQSAEPSLLIRATTVTLSDKISTVLPRSDKQNEMNPR